MGVEPATRCTDSPLHPRLSKTTGFMKEHWRFKVNVKKLWMLPTVEPDVRAHRDLYLLILTFTFWPVNSSTNPKEFLSGRFQDTMMAKVGRMDRWVEVLYIIIKKKHGQEKSFAHFRFIVWLICINLSQMLSVSCQGDEGAFCTPYRQNLRNTQRTLGITLRFPVCKNTGEGFICWLDVFFNFTLEKNANFMSKSAEGCIYQHFTTYDAFYTWGITKNKTSFDLRGPDLSPSPPQHKYFWFLPMVRRFNRRTITFTGPIY